MKNKKLGICRKLGLLDSYKKIGKLLLISRFFYKLKQKSYNYKFFLLTDLLLFEKKKKVNKSKFLRRRLVFNRRSILYMNFKHYLEISYKFQKKNIRRRYKNKWRKKRFYYTFFGKKKKKLIKFTTLYKLFRILRKKKKLEQRWRFYYRKRYLSFNFGFKHRQYILFSQLREMYPFRRHSVYLRRRFHPKRKLKYLVNYRRKIFKKEQKKKKLIVYSFRSNINHWTQRSKFNKKRYDTFLRVKQKQKFFLRLQRRRYQYIFRKLQIMDKNKNFCFFNYRPFWFKKGILIWRVRKTLKKKIYKTRLKQHYLNLVIIKQGLRYYYGNFRLFFLKKIAKQLKKSRYKLSDFILYLENSLFMVLYRCNFIAHPKLVIYLMRDNHKLFYVNYQYISFPLYQVKSGDLIGLKNRILQKMLNRFLRTKKIPSFLYVNHFLGIAWILRKPEIRDYTLLQVLPLKSLRYLVANLKYLI